MLVMAIMLKFYSFYYCIVLLYPYLSLEDGLVWNKRKKFLPLEHIPELLPQYRGPVWEILYI